MDSRICATAPSARVRISASAAPSADRKADKGKRVIRDSKASRASKANLFGDLRQSQQSLRDRLNKLLEEQNRGFGQNQQGKPGQQGRGQGDMKTTSAAPEKP